MASFALSELDMQQILKTLTTLSYVRRKATNILLLYNTHIGVFKMITKGNFLCTFFNFVVFLIH